MQGPDEGEAVKVWLAYDGEYDGRVVVSAHRTEQAAIAASTAPKVQRRSDFQRMHFRSAHNERWYSACLPSVTPDVEELELVD